MDNRDQTQKSTYHMVSVLQNNRKCKLICMTENSSLAAWTWGSRSWWLEKTFESDRYSRNLDHGDYFMDVHLSQNSSNSIF